MSVEGWLYGVGGVGFSELSSHIQELCAVEDDLICTRLRREGRQEGVRIFEWAGIALLTLVGCGSDLCLGEEKRWIIGERLGERPSLHSTSPSLHLLFVEVREPPCEKAISLLLSTETCPR